MPSLPHENRRPPKGGRSVDVGQRPPDGDPVVGLGLLVGIAGGLEGARRSARLPMKALDSAIRRVMGAASARA
jgi:hypothetical protein